MNTKSTFLVTGVALATLLAACQHPGPSSQGIRLSSGTAAAEHGIHSEQLRKIMWDLMLAPTDRLPQELDVEKEQKWRRSDAVRILTKMAQSADTIPEVLKGVELSQTRTEEFLRLAGELKTAATRLRDDVEQLTPMEIGKRFDSLQHNCNACHDRFRILPLLGESGRAEH